MARSQKATNDAHFGDVEAAAFAVLGKLVKHPLIHPREPEVVAALRTRISEGLKPRHVAAQLGTTQSKKGLVAEPPRLRLPRVLSEVSLEGLNGAAGKSGQRHPLRFDLGLLHADASPELELHDSGVSDVKLCLEPENLCALLEVKSVSGTYCDKHGIPRWGPRDLLKLLHAASRLERGWAGMLFVDRALPLDGLSEVLSTRIKTKPGWAAPDADASAFRLHARSGLRAPWPLTHTCFSWVLPSGIDPTGKPKKVVLNFKAVARGAPLCPGSVSLWALAVSAGLDRLVSGGPVKASPCRWDVSCSPARAEK